jgi:hypothetical protein
MKSWRPRVRLLAVLFFLAAPTGCSPTGRPTHAGAPLRTAGAIAGTSAIGPASLAASAARAFSSAGPGEFLFVGELMNGGDDCTARYGFSFANDVLGPTEGEDDQGRRFRCRYDNGVERGTVQWSADCYVTDRTGSRLRVLTMMHTAQEPRLTNGINVYDAFWVRGIVDLGSGASVQECAYSGEVVLRAELSLAE